MKARARAWTKVLAVAAFAIGYAILAHVSNSNPDAPLLGVVLAVAPIVTVAVAFLWRGGLRLPAVLLAVLTVFAVARGWPILAAHFPWLYLLQQAGAYGFLGVMFGRSLARGRVPLCTHWAAQVHGTLPPAMEQYTRRVTAAWTLFFGLVTAALIVLFLLAPLKVWSAFANFCCLPLVAAMFIGEYLARGRALPDVQHPGIMAGVRAFLGSTAAPDALRRG